jgi:hypothetical protein
MSSLDETTYGIAEKFYQFLPSTPERLKVKTRQVFLSIALLVMFLLLAVPVSNCIRLANDWTYGTLVGIETVSWLLGTCVALFFISVFLLIVFLSVTPYDRRTSQTMFMMGGIFLSCMGIILILFGLPMQAEAIAASDELLTNCGHGEKSGLVYNTFQDLSYIRASANCVDLDSIDQCAEYKSYIASPLGKTSAKIVEEMETSFHCSGFCGGTDSDGRRIYPPTLFSKGNYKLSCDGTAMRHLMGIKQDIAGTMVAEGAVLVGTAVAVSFGMVIGFCTWQTKTELEKAVEGL